MQNKPAALMERIKDKNGRHTVMGWAILGLLALILLYAIHVISERLPPAIDWQIAYYPAAREFISGRSPYYEGGYLENPVWIVLVLAPFAVFPENLSRALFLIASIFAYHAAFKSANIPTRWSILLFISPQVLYGLNLGTIDAFVLAAPAMPGVIGFMAALTKPQIGIGYALYLLVSWIREKKYAEMSAALALSTAGLLISKLLGMPFSGRLIDAPWNTSLFPWSILPGIVLIAAAIFKRTPGLSLMGGPMLAPYLTFHSWVTLFMVDNKRYLMIVFAISWAVYLTWHFSNV